MKKIIIIITSFILLLSLFSCAFFAYKYYTYKKIKTIEYTINAVDKKIEDIDKKINNKSIEKNDLKNNNSEKGELLELWKTSLEQIKSNS